jgi:hypothetical protein
VEQCPHCDEIEWRIFQILRFAVYDTLGEVRATAVVIVETFQ